MLDGEYSPSTEGLQAERAATLTVLRCEPGRWATKTYARDPGDPDKYVKVVDYSAGETFSFRELPFDGIEGLAGHLDELGATRVLHHRRRTDGVGARSVECGQNVYRRSGTPPVCFEERAIGLLYVDTDGVPAPDGVDETSDEALAHLEG